MSSDTDMVSVRTITGIVFAVCVVRITTCIVTAIEETVTVIVVAVRMRVFVGVNTSLPGISRVKCVRCRPAATANHVLEGERNEHHE